MRRERERGGEEQRERERERSDDEAKSVKRERANYWVCVGERI